LQVSWLENISNDPEHPDVLKGGVEDIGNFKEGFCFRLNSKTEIVWNICADSNRDKIEWMHAFEKLVPHDEAKNSVVGTYTPEKDIELPIKTQKPVVEE